MTKTSNPETLELSDIQGMITRGYSRLYETAYLHLKVIDSAGTKEWLKTILPLVDSADHRKKATKTLHIAFAHNGLKALGLHSENLENFPLPFREGICTANRNLVLGDHGQNDPNNWRWGEDNSQEILLIFHAENTASMDAFLNEQKAKIAEAKCVEISREMRGNLGKDNKEPFGFHDGISQPIIKGSGKTGAANDIIETGEFILGYKNEHDRYPFSPFIVKEQGDVSLLSDQDKRAQGLHDLGHNGSFMVFREMEQHVDKFWEAMENHTKNPDGTVNEEAKIRLASKCIGRWPSGASLVNYPDADPGGSLDNDDFGYAEKDPDGLKCPFGSHMRRNNPRDSFRSYDEKQSLKISKRHRIMRRGRKYQLPATASSEKPEIGLHFICFNADIELQFEFIQQTWANKNQTGKISNDIDVIIGVPPEGNPQNEDWQFTIQNSPTNEHYKGWDQFVSIKGGAYYFFPSIKAIEYLTTI